jgi:hypothetical protein
MEKDKRRHGLVAINEKTFEKENFINTSLRKLNCRVRMIDDLKTDLFWT